MNELDLLAKQFDKLEQQVQANQRQTTLELKELSADLKKAIKDGFSECRATAHLTCPIGKNKLSLAQAAGLCTVIVGVFLTLAKLGLLNGLLAVGTGS